MAAEPRPTRDQAAEEAGFADLLGRLASESSTLVRDEIALAKSEISEKASRASKAGIFLGAGTVIGLTGSLAIMASFVLLLSKWIDPWIAADIIGVLLIIIAAAVLYIGFNIARKINPKPEQTIETLKENRDFIKEQLSS